MQIVANKQTTDIENVRVSILVSCYKMFPAHCVHFSWQPMPHGLSSAPATMWPCSYRNFMEKHAPNSASKQKYIHLNGMNSRSKSFTSCGIPYVNFCSRWWFLHVASACVVLFVTKLDIGHDVHYCPSLTG